MMATCPGRDVAIVGGGLAGLSTAAALVSAGHLAAGGTVRVFEGRRRVGGRAASFEDPAAGELVDACQHVALGCCTNFLDLCRQTGVAAGFRRDRTLWFIGADNARSVCTASGVLPAPFHLVPLLGGMRHFSALEKFNLAIGILRLAWGTARSGMGATHEWLVEVGQNSRVIELFWRPVIESAVGESLELVALTAARKVIVDGFLAHRSSLDLHVPLSPLGELLGEGVAAWLERQGVTIETGAHVSRVVRAESGRVVGITVERRGDPSREMPCDACVLAVPWKQAAKLAPDVVPEEVSGLSGSPITAVHLWFDRAFVDLPHAVLVGRLSQWVFCPNGDHYCQVVISASRSLDGIDRTTLVERVVAELLDAFPTGRGASLTAARVVTDPTAVLSVRPGVDALRPGPTTAVAGLYLAGDWTATGWPSTMEGAVRSGRIAASAVLGDRGALAAMLSPDLPKKALVRLLIGA